MTSIRSSAQAVLFVVGDVVSRPEKDDNNMFKTLVVILCSVQMLTHEGKCLDLLEITDYSKTTKAKVDSREPPKVKYETYIPMKPALQPIRRYWLLNDHSDGNITVKPRVYEDEKDTNIKQKISTLVDQTMHDAVRKMELTEELKLEYREQSPYRAGFILSLVKKSKDVLDELFNVAIKHKDDWMALEQLKIFELIVHTNVDTTNLLRQLVDVHVKHLNATRNKRRVILL